MRPSLPKSSLQEPTNPLLYWGLFALLQVFLLLLAFAAGYIFHQWYTGDDLALVRRALTILTQNAYDPLPQPPALQYGMIRGMLQAMNDPYTVFVEPPQAELQSNQLEGKYGGIGVRLERDADNYIRLFPLPDSPAARAGILENDRLLRVDGKEITPLLSYDEVQAAIRGRVGQHVKITVGREPAFQPIEYLVRRAEVPLPSVTWNLAPDEARVGVIQINVIAETTPAEVRKAIQDLQQRGATHFILDLRNNGGGLVEAGVDTARLFLEKGTIIQQQYRGEEVKTYSVERPGPFTALPLAVLVNQSTASAAEILAGALQGQGRAPLVGSPTYGKDSIQLVFDLGDGSSLHVTAARWWVPGLEPAIRGHGLQPDVPVSEDDPDQWLRTAVETVLSQTR